MPELNLHRCAILDGAVDLSHHSAPPPCRVRERSSYSMAMPMFRPLAIMAFDRCASHAISAASSGSFALIRFNCASLLKGAN